MIDLKAHFKPNMTIYEKYADKIFDNSKLDEFDKDDEVKFEEDVLVDIAS